MATYPVYLKLYDQGTVPVVGTDTPKITIPFSAFAYWNGTAAVANPQPQFYSLSDIGVSFVNGIAYAITKGVADTDTTAIASADLVGINVFYQ